MPSFRYSAYRQDGGETAGVIDADSLRDARIRLKKEGLYPREITPAAEASPPGGQRLFRKGIALPADQRRTCLLAPTVTKDAPLLPAGLLGPVTLQTVQRLALPSGRAR